MAFELQPVLQNELIRVEPLRPEDFEALYAVASDPLIWEQHPAKDRYKREVFAGYFKSGIECGGALRGTTISMRCKARCRWATPSLRAVAGPVTTTRR